MSSNDVIITVRMLMIGNEIGGIIGKVSFLFFFWILVFYVVFK